MSKAKTKALHVTISLTMNEDITWEYTEPKVERDIVLHLPADFLTGTALTKYVEEQLKIMEKEFPEAVAQWEAKKAQEEAEKEKGA